MNIYRVGKAKEIIYPDEENLTMFAVAYDSGFSSKTSFICTLKETIGVMPSE